jgi:hypothetical protein
VKEMNGIDDQRMNEVVIFFGWGVTGDCLRENVPAGRTGDSGNSRLLALLYFPVVGLDMDVMEGGEDR